MTDRPDAKGTPPLIAMDPMGAVFTSWMKGVELGMAWTMLWQSMMASAARQGAVNVTLNMPFANGYTQTIDPQTNWGWITSQRTDDPEIEREVVQDVASYGQQIGRLMDLTLAIAQQTETLDPKKVEPVAEINRKVRAIKNRRGR